MYTAVANDVDTGCEVAQSAFRELPTLRLTPAQARRLWSLDPATCQRVLQRLVACGYLTVADDGRYCRPECLTASAGWDWPRVPRRAPVPPSHHPPRVRHHR
jgi:hypothetical protein